MRSKEYYLIKQGLHRLEVKEKKEFIIEIAYIAEVESFNTPSPYLLPLSDFFVSNFFFLILPNVLSDNTPIPFL